MSFSFEKLYSKTQRRSRGHKEPPRWYGEKKLGAPEKLPEKVEPKKAPVYTLSTTAWKLPELGTVLGYPRSFEPDPVKKRRGLAVARLWKHTLDGLIIRHPDPSVEVRTSVNPHVNWAGEYDGTADGELCMYKVRDTRDPDERIGSFGMSFRCVGWPGKEAAELFVLAYWTIYAQHEATELVSYRDKVKPKSVDHRGYWYGTFDDSTRVLDIHRYYADPRTMHHLAQLQHGIDGRVEECLAFLVGKDEAARLVRRCAPRAAEELENEIRWLEEGGE